MMGMNAGKSASELAGTFLNKLGSTVARKKSVLGNAQTGLTRDQVELSARQSGDQASQAESQEAVAARHEALLKAHTDSIHMFHPSNNMPDVQKITKHHLLNHKDLPGLLEALRAKGDSATEAEAEALKVLQEASVKKPEAPAARSGVFGRLTTRKSVTESKPVAAPPIVSQTATETAPPVLSSSMQALAAPQKQVSTPVKTAVSSAQTQSPVLSRSDLPKKQPPPLPAAKPAPSTNALAPQRKPVEQVRPAPAVSQSQKPSSSRAPVSAPQVSTANVPLVVKAHQQMGAAMKTAATLERKTQLQLPKVTAKWDKQMEQLDLVTATVNRGLERVTGVSEGEVNALLAQTQQQVALECVGSLSHAPGTSRSAVNQRTSAATPQNLQARMEALQGPSVSLDELTARLNALKKKG